MNLGEKEKEIKEGSKLSRHWSSCLGDAATGVNFWRMVEGGGTREVSVCLLRLSLSP